MRRPYRLRIARALATAFLAPGTRTHAGLLARAGQTIGERPAWASRLASRVLARFADPTHARPRDLERFVFEDDGLEDACSRPPVPRIRRLLVPEPKMHDSLFAVPPIATAGDLARWLDVGHGELAWLADARGLERTARDDRLRHYRYAWVAKRSGGGARLLEAPKARTKSIQRRILEDILAAVPPHDSVHGFRHGRSIASHASLHASKNVVLRLDLADFFLSVGGRRVAAIFRSAGYPEEVAWLLTCLTTNIAPARGASALKEALGRHATSRDLADIHRAQILARTRHLPQGAPTCPASSSTRASS